MLRRSRLSKNEVVASKEEEEKKEKRRSWFYHNKAGIRLNEAKLFRKKTR
jgi:hypothetical protein